MTPYILTAWLIYSDASVPDVRTPYPDQAQCWAAQAAWQARAIEWLLRTRLKPTTGEVIVSRCDPVGGAASLREAHLMSYPDQAPLP